MKQTFDTDAVLYKTLKADTGITGASLTGDIWVRQRPEGSKLEDIVVNTIALTQDSFPQIGTSNINVHVPDLAVTVNGAQTKVSNDKRLKAISALVLSAIRTVKVPGLKMIIEGQNVIQEPEINQHYVNIRVNWNIHE